MSAEQTRQITAGKYRPEIDGLRAFAVVAVIINHFNKNILPGGYLGVDIFFVISGYVITSSLYGRSSKDFKDFISGFYERRIKRLVPALAVFVLATSLMAHLLVQNAGRYYITGALSLFGLSNFYILSEAGGYWGLNASMNPFTQTWSLGVEEQFYILFPFLIYFSGFGRQTKDGSRNLFLVVGALSIASLVSFIHLYPTNQSAAYFLMPSRFWEMAAGCLVFIGFTKRVSLEKLLEKVPPFLLVSLIIGIMYLPTQWGAVSTVAVVSLTTILLASLKDGTGIFSVFTQPAVIYLGLISYSLYLWHWGFLSLARWSFGITKATVIPLLVITLLTSVLSYEFVEKKTRRISWSPRRAFTIAKGILASAAVASFSILLGTGLRARFYLGENTSTNPPQNASPYSTFHLFGDSHANDVYNLLLNNGSFKVENYTIGGCGFYKSDSSKCSGHIGNTRRMLANVKKGDVVILASNYLPLVAQDTSEVDSIIRYLRTSLPPLMKKGVTIIFKLPHPEVNPPNEGGEGLICKREFFRPVINDKCFVEGVSKKIFFAKMESIEPIVAFLRNEFPNVLFWDISDITCPGEYCIPVTSERQYLQDSSHLFLTSATLSNELVLDLNNLLVSSLNQRRRLSSP